MKKTNKKHGLKKDETELNKYGVYFRIKQYERLDNDKPGCVTTAIETITAVDDFSAECIAHDMCQKLQITMDSEKNGWMIDWFVERFYDDE